MNTALIAIGIAVVAAWLIRLAIQWIKAAGQEPPDRSNTHRLR